MQRTGLQVTRLHRHFRQSPCAAAARSLAYTLVALNLHDCVNFDHATGSMCRNPLIPSVLFCRVDMETEPSFFEIHLPWNHLPTSLMH